MTEMPQSNEMPETTGPDAQGDPPPTFAPYVPPAAPAAPSRRPLIFIGLSVVVVIIGLVFWSGEPDEADAKPVKADVSKMTAQQLAEDSSPRAAKELVRRMYHGTNAERATASSVINHPQSQRLRRNLAMAMAYEMRNRANTMRNRAEREMQMAEEGY